MFSNFFATPSLEKSTLYYISGYVAFKEGCSVDIQEIQGDDSEFVNKVSRGRLGHHPSELYNLSQYLFAFFKTREKKCCPKLFLDAYQMIYDTTNFEFDNISSILRRFNDSFFKEAFANNINDKLKRFKDDKRLSNAVLVVIDSYTVIVFNKICICILFLHDLIK